MLHFSEKEQFDCRKKIQKFDGIQIMRFHEKLNKGRCILSICVFLIIIMILPISIGAGFKFGIKNLIKPGTKEINRKIAEKVIANPPTISITNPADNSIVSGTVDLTADASDDKGISKVEFYIDGTFKAIDTSSPYSYYWDTTAGSDGSHTIKVIAYDTANQTAEGQCTVMVDNIDDAPSVSITNPSDGAMVWGTVNITADASDDRGISKVEFYADGELKKTDTSSPYSYSWDMTAISRTGSHTVKVIVYDTANQMAEDQHVVTDPYELPDTGQEQSYTGTFGEDNDYEAVPNQPSYTDNENGTITDNRTGLMWVKDGNSTGCNNGNPLTWEEALSFCEGLDYAGYSDWRLPNRRELMSIVDYGEQLPAINTTYFPNTKSEAYLSSTPASNGCVWYIGFDHGSMGNVPPTCSGLYVRSVRAGCSGMIPPPQEAHPLPDTGQEQSYTETFGEDNDYIAPQPSYTDNGDGTITDDNTGLMWVKDGNSAGCNNGNPLTWEEALSFCEGLDYAGYSDWRLPNIRECESIENAGESSPVIKTTYFPNTVSNYYWSSTTNVSDVLYKWTVDFNYGGVYTKKCHETNYIRPARAGCTTVPPPPPPPPN